MDNVQERVESWRELVPEQYVRAIKVYAELSVLTGQQKRTHIFHKVEKCIKLSFLTPSTEKMIDPWGIERSASWENTQWCPDCWVGDTLGANAQRGAALSGHLRGLQTWPEKERIKAPDTFRDLNQTAQVITKNSAILHNATLIATYYEAHTLVARLQEEMNQIKSLKHFFATYPVKKIVLEAAEEAQSLLSQNIILLKEGMLSIDKAFKTSMLESWESGDENFLIANSDLELCALNILGYKYSNLTQVAVWAWGRLYKDVWIGRLPEKVRKLALIPQHCLWSGESLDAEELETARTFYWDGMHAADAVNTARSLSV